MIDRFLQYIEQNNLFEKKDRIIAAISGGVDSVVMLNLLLRAGFKNVVVAHCNFKLRGEESDNDEKFVKELAKKNNLPVYLKSFDTLEYARKKSISVQMAARDLRYVWFEELRANIGYDYIAVAHNKNDLVETMLYNLSRGTGLYGLVSIKSKNGKIVRPLLFAKRSEIENYANKNAIVFRDDSSNNCLKYKRNYIRYKIIPEFETLSKNFIDAAFTTANNLNDYALFFNFIIERVADTYIKKTKNKDLIIEKKFFDFFGNFSHLALWQLLRKYNCKIDVCKNIVRSLDNTGAKFYCNDYKISIGREVVYVYKLDTTNKHFVIESLQDISSVDLPIGLRIFIQPYKKKFEFGKNKNIAYVDADKIRFPLVIRKWKYGDAFLPFGLKKRKKLSDFFTDIKLDEYHKDKTFVIVDAEGRIVWVVGHRSSEIFRVTNETSTILIFETTNF